MRSKYARSFRRGNKRRRHTKRILELLIVLAAAVFIFCSIRLADYFIKSEQRKKTNSELNALFEANQTPTDANVPENSVLPEMRTETEAEAVRPAAYQRVGEISPKAAELYGVNHDLIAWLQIPGVISLPVVYRNNEYYLTHDYYGNPSDAGTLFLDQYHPFLPETQYLLIHGHSMYDGSMFASVTHFRKTDYIKAHPTLTLNTLYSRDEYEIIGSLYISEADMVSVAGMGTPSFSSASQFTSFIDTLRAHAMHFTDEPVSPDAALLALSTCYEDGRIVVVYKRTSSVPL